MQKTSRVRALRPAPGGPGTCSAQLSAMPSDKHAVCGPGLCEAAGDFEQLIARIDPEQLTSADRERLRDLLRQLSFLLKLGS